MSSCYNGAISGYILDGSIYKKLPSCYNLCATCTAYPINPSIDMECKTNSCVIGYYPKEDNMTSCFKGDIFGYALEGSIYKKKIEPPCYSLCKTCTGYPSDPKIDMMCKPGSCQDGYYPMINKMTSCFKGDLPIAKYYLDGNVFQKCYSLCETCKKYPSDPTTDMSCDTCITGYFPKQDSSTSCFTGEIEQYYLDNLTNKYRNCYMSCLTCGAYYENDNHNCKKCMADYYPMEGKSSNCYKKDEIINGYYFNDKFSSCYPACMTCGGSETSDNPSCNKCKDVELCKPCTGILYKDECKTTCPQDTIFIKDLNTCYSCKEENKLIHESSCVSDCPEGYIGKDYICVTCNSVNLFNLNGHCVENCQSGYTVKDGICTPRKVIVINFIVNICNESTCRNGGVCSIEFETIVCTCISQYTGLFCEVLNNTPALRDYICNSALI
jgi:hypothetical protein